MFLLLRPPRVRLSSDFWCRIKVSKLHPSKKVTQPDFDRLYLFYPGFVFIKLDIPGKPVYLPLDWYLICSDCFTEACVGWVNWGQLQKLRVAKLLGFYGKCVLYLVSRFPFVSVCTRTRCARAAKYLFPHFFTYSACAHGTTWHHPSVTTYNNVKITEPCIVCPMVEWSKRRDSDALCLLPTWHFVGVGSNLITDSNFFFFFCFFIIELFTIRTPQKHCM